MWGVSGSNPEAVQRQVLLTKMESAMFEHAMQGIQSYRKNNPLYQINDLEWDDLIEAHNTDIAEAEQKIEALQNDLSIAQETCKRYRAQLSRQSGLVPADKAVR